MVLHAGNLVVELKAGGLFVRVPYVGQAYLGNGMTAADSWGTLRRTREV